MKKSLVLVSLISLLLLTGCIAIPPSHVIMTNPNTGEWVYLQNNGASWAAFDNQQKAINAMRMQGYTEMKVVK